MGGSSSTPKVDSVMEHHQPYPDMNVIFKGIPKMIQVADDMHRMTNYIMDLRNMTIGLVCLSVVGMLFFLLMKIAQGRNSAARRKRELGRPVESLEDRILPRHTHYGAYHGYLDSWQDSRSTKGGGGSTAIDIEKIPMSQSQNESNHTVETTATPLEARSMLNGHAHKRLEPVKLLVEDLPYADT